MFVIREELAGSSPGLGSSSDIVLLCPEQVPAGVAWCLGAAAYEGLDGASAFVVWQAPQVISIEAVTGGDGAEMSERKMERTDNVPCH